MLRRVTAELGRRYPQAVVHGVDLDETSIALARANLADSGVEERARFDVGDLADARQGHYDVATMFEALGLDPETEIKYAQNRPLPIAKGKPIRDVMAFPKSQSGNDPLTGAPAPVSEAQLRELGIRLATPPPERT